MSKQTAKAESPSNIVPVNQNANLPADSALFDSVPTGYENVTGRDLVIPRLVILQGLSPQLDKNKPEYIAGAASGDFCDVALGEVWKDTLRLVPCYFTTVWLEWGPRQSGKGLIANYGPDERKAKANASENEERKWVTKEGNIISQTPTFFVLNMSAGGRRSFIPMSSTQIKSARTWMTAITALRRPTAQGEVQAPMFYREWEARAVGQSNAKGSWNGWKFSAAGVIDKTTLAEVLDFRKQIEAGLVQGSFGEEDRSEEDSEKM